MSDDRKMRPMGEHITPKFKLVDGLSALELLAQDATDHDPRVVAEKKLRAAVEALEAIRAMPECNFRGWLDEVLLMVKP